MISWKKLITPPSKSPKDIKEWLGLITDAIKSIKGSENWYDDVSLLTSDSIVNDLETGGIDKMLSSEQGKILNQNINKLSNKVQTQQTIIEEVTEQMDKIDIKKANEVDLNTLKTRMDGFSSLPEGSTTGDAELIDGRVSNDGVKFENIGGNIRSLANVLVEYGVVTCQWQYSTNLTTWNDTTVSGSGYDTNTLKLEANSNRNGYYYRCKFTDEEGNVIYSETSQFLYEEGDSEEGNSYKPEDGFKVLINPFKIVRKNSGNFSLTSYASKIKIKAKEEVEEARQSYIQYDNLKDRLDKIESVTMVNDSLKYEWYYSNNNGSTWAKCVVNTTLSGEDTDTLVLKLTSGRNGFLYKCVITNSIGETLETDSVQLIYGDYSRIERDVVINYLNSIILTKNTPISISNKDVNVTIPIEAYSFINRSVTNNNSKLNGLSILNFGDSIAEGNANNYISYAHLIANKYNMTLYTYAKGGSTIVPVSGSSNILAQLESAKTTVKNPKFILFDGLVNDIVKGINEVGEDLSSTLYDTSSADTTNFSQTFEKTIHEIKKAYPNSILIYIATPKTSARDLTKHTLFYEKAIQHCKKWSVPVVDLFNKSAWNTHIVEVNTSEYSPVSSDSPTGYNRIHPNTNGYEVHFCPLITSTMESLT